MGKSEYDVWIDISNTPQVFVFKSLLKELKEYSILITTRHRGETVKLMKLLGVDGKVVGRDYNNPFLKSIAIGLRALELLPSIPKFRVALSFENPMPIPTAKLRRKDVVLMLDNDVKVLYSKAFFQKMETKVKKLSDYVIVPKAAEENFSKVFKKSRIITYDGYKEHLYIADYIPNENILREIPFEEYVVLRPESLSSLYVLHNRSLVPEILKRFEKESINVVYLPRSPDERKLVKGFNSIYIPAKVLNGLDLSYFAKTVLTGSGTMAREAALLGTPAVSFFPGKKLLAVDEDLITKGKMFHSREPEEIVDYVLENWNKRREPEFEKGRKVKEFIVRLVREIVDDVRKKDK